jgi:protein phosphatase
MAKKQSSTSGLVAALEIASATDAGKVRSNNEDSVLANAAAGLVVLADGMGGYNAGEVASGMATMMLGADLEKDFAATPPSLKTAEGYRAHQALTRRIQEVNAAIYQAATTQMQYSGMGTTLVAAVFHDNHVSVAHLGDSRMYRLREGQLAQITKDHSLLQEQMDLGIITPAQAKQSMNKNLVTRGLGVEGDRKSVV